MNTCLLTLLCGQVTLAVAASDTLDLTRDRQPACKVLVVSADRPEPLMQLAGRAIIETVQQWGGAELPLVQPNESSRMPPAESAIVLATWDRLKQLWPDVASLNPDLLRVEFLDPQGFVCVPVRRGDMSYMCIVARSARGVYNGAVYLREFLIDGRADNLRLDLDAVVRTPHMPGRPVYLLTIWGEEDEYAPQDYLPVFASFARDGASHIYFWLSGHFPSKKYPQTWKVNDNNWDSTTDSRISTIEDQRLLIRYAHDLGMEFYLGGALGAWCGSFMLTNREPGTMRTASRDEQGGDTSEWSLCPSDPRSRRSLVEYYKEMYDALPEADGLYMESADEYGECKCDRCQAPVDQLGSKAFGQNQLSLMREMMAEIWKDHPRARLAYTIGYSPHVKDPAYYEVVRQMSGDPRVEWMEARDSWQFPGPDGQPLPAAFFSPRVMRWEYIDDRPLDQMVHNTMRVASSGMYGYIMTFSPGFSSGSFYHDIPLPTDLMPYILTHFVYREATWQPVGTTDEMKARVQRRFFGKTAPASCAEDLWALREILRESARRKLTPGNRRSLEEIEARVSQLRRSADPKTRAGLDLMTRAIEDIRKFCKETPAGKTASQPAATQP